MEIKVKRQMPLVVATASDLAAFMVETPTLQVRFYVQDKSLAITEYTHICMSNLKVFMRS
jgi:hypothetical protein